MPASEPPPGLVTATAIAALDRLAKTHFLNPDARRMNLSLGDLVGITGFGIHLIAVEPGFASTEHHLHHYEDECVFVLEGEATVTIGDIDHPIGPGDFIGHPRGGPAHSIRNTGTTVLRCLVVGQRLAHDVTDYPRRGKRLYRNAGMAWNLVDTATIDEPSAGGKR